MPRRYDYPLPAKFDPYYLRAVLDRELPGLLLGWSETPTQIRFDFARELTPAEKAKLDSIAASPPMPAARYAFGYIDADDVEKAVGVRPVRVDVRPETGEITIDFDSPLTPAQEARLEELCRSPRSLKKARL